MIFLLHSSKTMRQPRPTRPAQTPALLARAVELANFAQTLSAAELARTMHLSAALAGKTQATFAAWNAEPTAQSLAIDSFVGDIYSGLRADSLSVAERDYANQHLRILSGLYGILRPYDGIRPYRLEMGYKLPDRRYANLYDFWGDTITKQLPANGPIINLASVEYSRTITPFVDASRLITPKFLTVDLATGQPNFVVVHAKIARGAFARWLITNRASKASELPNFAEIGYRFAPKLSTPEEPVFVCQEFGGKGLSMRLVSRPIRDG